MLEIGGIEEHRPRAWWPDIVAIRQKEAGHPIRSTEQNGTRTRNIDSADSFQIVSIITP